MMTPCKHFHLAKVNVRKSNFAIDNGHFGWSKWPVKV